MEISYKGANCVVIKAKQALIVVDPTTNVKTNEATNKDAVVLVTQSDFAPKAAPFVIDMPGEYEHNDVSIQGIAVSRQIDPEGKNSTLYRVELDGLKIAVVGHTMAPLSDDDLESIGMIDIAIIPVGGGGYTLDARDATTIIRQLSPKIIIPTHFDDSGVKYEVPQESIDVFTKEIGLTPEKVTSLKIKNGALPESMTVYELARS